MRSFMVLGLFLWLLSGCQQQDAALTAGGKVEPNAAYLQHFGQPPEVQQGIAYAQVGYLPVAAGGGKVAPIPLFQFGTEHQLEKVIAQLFSDQLPGASRSNLLPLANLGVRLQQTTQLDETLLIELQVVAAAVSERAGIDRALAETALQFAGIKRVQIRYDGTPSPLQPATGYRSRPDQVLPVGPPVLLDVAGIWEAGADAPAELVTGFDRPVRVERFRLLDTAGEKLAGKYYRSIFDMAVVLHPTVAADFTVGMPLRVEWQVVDALGRKSAGAEAVKLLRRQH